MIDLKAFAQKLGLDWDVSLTGDRQLVLNSEEEEQLSCSYSGVELVVGDPGSSAGTGSVFVTTRCGCASSACTLRACGVVLTRVLALLLHTTQAAGVGARQQQWWCRS